MVYSSDSILNIYLTILYSFSNIDYFSSISMYDRIFLVTGI